MKNKLLFLSLLIPSFVLAQEDCSTFTPTHVSGIHIHGPQLKAKDVAPLFKGIASPSISVDWNRGANKDVLSEFLKKTKGKDRRIQIYIGRPEAISELSDDIVGFLYSSGQFTQNLNAFDPYEIALCFARNDTLSDSKFQATADKARESWPWSICRNPKLRGTTLSYAGSDALSVTDTKVNPAKLATTEYSLLEYAFSNVGTKMSRAEILKLFRKHYDAGVFDLQVWYNGGNLSQYRSIIQSLDRLAYAQVPAYCRDSEGQIIDPVIEDDSGLIPLE